MSEKTLGVAIFGAGRAAGEHARAFASNPRTRLLPSSGDVSHRPFAGHMEALVASILDGVPCQPGLDGAAATQEIVFASAISAREGRSVSLPLPLNGSAG